MRRVFILILLCLLSGGAAWAQLGQCAVPTGPLRPDLIVDPILLRAQMYLSEETFGPNSCTVQEGCVTAPGDHLVLRFTSSTPNIGQTDLFIGDPSPCTNLFRLSECHQHLHFKEYSDYRLWTPSGYNTWVAGRDLTQPTNSGGNKALLDAAVENGSLLVGRKQGFCMIDLVRYQVPGVRSGGPPKFLSCSGNQGISVGWADQYVAQLSCQFIQMTNVPEGEYVLEVHVNPEQLLPESNFTNNASAVRFQFKKKPGRFGPAVEIVD